MAYNNRRGVVFRCLLHLPPSSERVGCKVVAKEVLLPKSKSADVSDREDELHGERREMNSCHEGTRLRYTLLVR